MPDQEIKDEERGPIKQFYELAGVLNLDMAVRSPRLKDYAASVPELQFIVGPSDDEFGRIVALRFRLGTSRMGG